MKPTVAVGDYRGWAIVAGYKADVDLSATQQLVNNGRGGAIAAPVTWSGTAIILDLTASRNLLELEDVIDVTVGERTSRAAVIDVTPGSQSLQLKGAGDPPFELTGRRTHRSNSSEAGTYDGPVTIDGHDAYAQLDAIRDRHDLQWRGAVFYNDPTSVTLPEATARVHLVVEGRAAVAAVVYSSPTLSYLFVHGLDTPPFDHDVTPRT